MSNDTRQLFVVGSPRSGTTLLRNLLHGHQSIALTAYESHFVPAALRRYGAHPHISNPVEASAFLSRFKRGLLYQKGRERGVFCPADSELTAAVDGDSWAIVLRNLFALYCDKDMRQAQIWGDKTPAYVDHIDLIDGALPNARFVHIIRDPRDQALSERAIWGKSLRRSAETWRQRITGARSSRAAAGGRYIELTYEGLVHDPEYELQRLSAWLEIDFQPSMLSSFAGSDELGQMVGAEEISEAAVGGRRGHLSANEETVIASLTGKLGESLSYNLPTVTPRQLRRIEISILAVHDRLALVVYFMRRKGLSSGLRFAVGSLVDGRKELNAGSVLSRYSPAVLAMAAKRRWMPASLALYFGKTNASTSELEHRFFAKVRLPNGAYKTTYRHRLDDLNEMVLECLLHDRELIIMDAAVSSGISTVEWSDHLHAHGLQHKMVAGDIVDAWLTSWGTSMAVLFDGSGQDPLLLEVGPLMLRMHSDRRLAKMMRPLLFPILRAVATIGHHFGSAAPMAPPVRRRWVHRPIQLVGPELLRRTEIDIRQDDLTMPNRFPETFDAIRVANLLYHGYFDDETLIKIVRNLLGRLKDSGLLIICRTMPSDDTNRASIFRRNGHCFELETSLNGGVEIQDLVLALDSQKRSRVG